MKLSINAGETVLITCTAEGADGNAHTSEVSVTVSVGGSITVDGAMHALAAWTVDMGTVT